MQYSEARHLGRSCADIALPAVVVIPVSRQVHGRVDAANHATRLALDLLIILEMLEGVLLIRCVAACLACGARLAQPRLPGLPEHGNVAAFSPSANVAPS